MKAYPTLFLVGRDGTVKWKDHFENPQLIRAIEAELAAPPAGKGR